VTVNNLYITVKNRRVKNPKATDISKDIKFELRDKDMMAGIKKEATLFLYGKWFTIDGRAKKKDASNYIKMIEDAVCGALGFDDSEIFAWHVYKVQDEKKKGFKILIDYI
jgi:Holliday junction resolvase RusA-like endonuclease